MPHFVLIMQAIFRIGAPVVAGVAALTQGLPLPPPSPSPHYDDGISLPPTEDPVHPLADTFNNYSWFHDGNSSLPRNQHINEIGLGATTSAHQLMVGDEEEEPDLIHDDFGGRINQMSSFDFDSMMDVDGEEDYGSALLQQQDPPQPGLHQNIITLKRNGVRKKENSALFHMGIFLKSYLLEKNVPHVEAAHLCYTGTGRRGMNDAFWDDMIGCFFTYLGTAAMKMGNPVNGRISYSSATGYASSVKTYFTMKFRGQQDSVPVFQRDVWRTYRLQLLKCFEEEVRKTGKAIAGSHLASTDMDRIGIAKACIWFNTPPMAEFWHLNNTSFQCSGRGSEVSHIRKCSVTTLSVTDIRERRKQALLPTAPS
jgi:hypothetical protein